MRRRYDEEFKKNTVALSYAGTRPAAQAAADHGIRAGMLYRRQKHTPNGEKTQYATIEEELKALKLENAQLKMERDMLKKASAYFTSPRNQRYHIYQDE